MLSSFKVLLRGNWLSRSLGSAPCLPFSLSGSVQENSLSLLDGTWNKVRNPFLRRQGDFYIRECEAKNEGSRGVSQDRFRSHLKEKEQPQLQCLQQHLQGALKGTLTALAADYGS
jgi:hypothetical protein